MEIIQFQVLESRLLDKILRLRDRVREPPRSVEQPVDLIGIGGAGPFGLCGLGGLGELSRLGGRRFVPHGPIFRRRRSVLDRDHERGLVFLEVANRRLYFSVNHLELFGVFSRPAALDLVGDALAELIQLEARHQHRLAGGRVLDYLLGVVVQANQPAENELDLSGG